MKIKPEELFRYLDKSYNYIYRGSNGCWYASFLKPDEPTKQADGPSIIYLRHAGVYSPLFPILIDGSSDTGDTLFFRGDYEKPTPEVTPEFAAVIPEVEINEQFDNIRKDLKSLEDSDKAIREDLSELIALKHQMKNLISVCMKIIERG